MNHAIKIYLFLASLAALVCLLLFPGWPYLGAFVSALGAASVLHGIDLRARSVGEQAMAKEILKLNQLCAELKKRLESMENRTGFSANVKTPFDRL